MWNGSSWNGPSPVGSSTLELESVSCASSHFCVAVDDNGGADTWNGATWTGPIAVGSDVAMESVSCASSTFCVAVDDRGECIHVQRRRVDGPPRHRLVKPSSMRSRVPVPTFCVAVDDIGNALTYNGSSWSADDIDGYTQLVSVSCATASFCVAGDTNGNAFTYNGSSWSSVTIDDNVITSVSCPTHLVLRGD